MRRRTLISKLFRAVDWLFQSWIGGMYVLDMLIGFETLLYRYPVQEADHNGKVSMLGRHAILCVYVSRGAYILIQRGRK